MNESYLTMLDYEKVLENVSKILPRIHGSNIRGSMHGGAHLVDEEEKEHTNAFSINPVGRDSR
jgi:homoserine kinase